MAEVPVIVSDLPEMKKLVQSYEIGYILKDGSVDEIVGVLNRFDKNQVSTFKRNLAEFNKIYNWESQEEILASIYSGL